MLRFAVSRNAANMLMPKEQEEPKRTQKNEMKSISSQFHQEQQKEQNSDGKLP